MLSELVTKIKERASSKKPFVIGICGFGGAGKTTTAHKLAEALGNAHVINVDDFIVNRLKERSADWNGFDWGRLEKEVLEPIRQGKATITYGIYDWKSDSIPETKTVSLEKYVILEGVGLFKESFRKYFDFLVYVDVPHHIALERGKKRDIQDHWALWDELWSKNDHDYHEKHKPKEQADFILKNDK